MLGSSRVARRAGRRGGRGGRTRTRNRARNRQTVRWPTTGERERRQSALTVKYLEDRSRPISIEETGEDIGAGECAFGGWLATTLNEIINADLADFDDQDLEEWRASPILGTLTDPGAAISNALLALVCTDCRATDWDTAAGDLLRKQIALLEETQDFIAYGPLDIALLDAARKGCPPPAGGDGLAGLAPQERAALVRYITNEEIRTVNVLFDRPPTVEESEIEQPPRTRDETGREIITILRTRIITQYRGIY